MARITVNDCLEKIPNRFDLTLVAVTRARQLSSSQKNEPNKDKPTVKALREVASGEVGMDILFKKSNSA